MNIYSILGFILAIIVLGVGFKLSTEDLTMFADYPSMFIVFGGTLAATAICFQLDHILVMIKVFFQRIFFTNKDKLPNTITEIVNVAQAYRKGEPLDQLISRSKDHFLKEALEMLNSGIMDQAEIIEIMESRAVKNYQNQLEEAKKVKTLGKFPPAFGMMGTTIGMIVLLANLGGKDAIKMIGPAMGVCLITTLYGVIVANLFLIPVGENLLQQTKENFKKNQMVIDGLKMLVKKSNPIVICENLNSFLKPSERLDWKKVVGG